MTGSARDRQVAVVFALAIFVASLLPVPTSTTGSGGASDGIAATLPAEVGVTAPFHLLGYATLAALLVRASEEERRLVAVAAGATAVTAFGFGIELIQAPIPWRSFAWKDVAVNAIGAIAGAGGYALRQR